MLFCGTVDGVFYSVYCNNKRYKSREDYCYDMLLNVLETN